MSSNFAVAETLEDRLVELGGISPSRLRLNPRPGEGKLGDLLRINELQSEGLFELIDGCLVDSEGDVLAYIHSNREDVDNEYSDIINAYNIVDSKVDKYH